jgi:Protein of unknown function (DUF2568)
MTVHGPEAERTGRGGAASPSLSPRQGVLLALRAVMETAIVLGLAYWGWQAGSSTIAKIGLAIGASIVGFGFWGLVDFHQVGRAAELLRLVEELVISGLVALAVWSAGLPVAGVLLALLSVVYHALVYATGGRLLKPR